MDLSDHDKMATLHAGDVFLFYQLLDINTSVLVGRTFIIPYLCHTFCVHNFKTQSSRSFHINPKLKQKSVGSHFYAEFY